MLHYRPLSSTLSKTSFSTFLRFSPWSDALFPYYVAPPPLLPPPPFTPHPRRRPSSPSCNVPRPSLSSVALHPDPHPRSPFLTLIRLYDSPPSLLLHCCHPRPWILPHRSPPLASSSPSATRSTSLHLRHPILVSHCRPIAALLQASLARSIAITSPLPLRRCHPLPLHRHCFYRAIPRVSSNSNFDLQTRLT